MKTDNFGIIRDIQFHPDSDSFVYIAQSSKITSHEISTLRNNDSISCRPLKIKSICFCLNNRKMAMATSEGAIILSKHDEGYLYKF